MKTLINYFKNLFNKDNNEDIELWGWMLWVWEQDTDFLFWAINDLKSIVRERWYINRQVVYEYNQWAQYETRNRCTIYSAVTEVSWLMNYRYSLKEILIIGRKMVKEWALDPNRWAYLHSAIDYVRRDWNERFPERPIESYRIDYSDKDMREFLTHDTPRLTQLGYRTSSELYNEVQTKWWASKRTYPKNGWHAVSQWGMNTINNYYGKTLYNWKRYRNRFSFMYIDDLIKNDIIYKNWYVFLRRA